MNSVRETFFMTKLRIIPDKRTSATNDYKD